MATSQVRNMRQIIIGGSPVAITTAAAPDGMNEGEIGIFNDRNVRQTEALAAAEGKIKVALMRAAAEGPLFSDVIDVANIKSISRTVHVARTHQVTSIGYDGATAGTALEVIASNLYYARLYLQELIRSNSDGRRIKQGVFKSTSTSTQADIALGLVNDFARNMLKEPEQFVTFEANCNAAGVAVGTGAGTYTATQGSTLVSVSTDVDDATGNAATVVGGYFRFGTGTGDPMYKVVAMDTTANTLTLDAPYREATATFANNAVENVTAAAGAAADWGLTITGQDLTFDPGKFNYALPMWEMGLENFGSSSSTTTGASKGKGEAEEIMQVEWFLKGDQSGEIYRVGEPNLHASVNEASLAVAGGGYDTIHIVYEQSENVTFGPEVSAKELVIAVPATAPAYALAASADDITDILEATAVLAGLGTVDLSMT